MNWLRKIATYCGPRPPEHTVEIGIELDPIGITQTFDGIPVRIEWCDVISVFAWKKDCFASDQVRLVIESTQHTIECREGDANFEACIPLNTYLPGCLPDWYLVLTSSPAFTPTVTKIFPSEEK